MSRERRYDQGAIGSSFINIIPEAVMKVNILLAKFG